MPVPQGVDAPNEAPFISCNYFSCCETTEILKYLDNCGYKVDISIKGVEPVEE